VKLPKKVRELRKVRNNLEKKQRQTKINKNKKKVQNKNKSTQTTKAKAAQPILIIIGIIFMAPNI